MNRQQQRQRRGDDGDGSISDEDFDRLASLDVLGLGLGSSTNLGCIDFYPIRSGKKNWCDLLILTDYVNECENKIRTQFYL